MTQRMTILAALLIAGCAFGKPLTQTEIDQYGSHTYSAPSPKVFAAVVKTLQTSGYETPVQNTESGKIKTNRKVIGALSQNDEYSSQSSTITRQLYVEVKAQGDSKTLVVVKPALYRGEVDLSDGAVWILEGSGGEREIWKKMFSDINDVL